MPHMNMAMPVTPGKENEARAFAREVAGPRRSEFAAFQALSATYRETRTIWRVSGGGVLGRILVLSPLQSALGDD
jgi:hypothetical protein